MKVKNTAYKWGVLGGLILVIFYFVTRLPNLLNIPIFTDEAIYLRWGQIALSDPRWRFISLVDGKQPLFIWLLLPMLKLFSDPLLAGRLTSVFIGVTGMIGMMMMGYFVSQHYRPSLIAGGLYLFSPFFLLYNRLALYESLVLSLAIWSLLLTYMMAKTLRLDVALILGGVIGAGFLTKSSLNFFWYLLPLSFLLIEFKQKTVLNKLLKWLGLLLIVTVISQLLVKMLYLSEFRHMVGLKNMTFVYSLKEFLQNPLLNLWGNFLGLSGWLIGYLTLPLFILMVISVMWFIRHNFRSGLFFLIYFIVPFLSTAWFGKVIYPRFLIFMIPPLILMTAIFIDELIKKKKLKYLIVSVLTILIFLIYFDYKILTDPMSAPLPQADYNQFINDWPAGYGIKEIVEFLEMRSRNKPVVVGTEGTFGLFPMALELYLGENKNIEIRSYWPITKVPQDLRELAKTHETYLVFKEKQTIPDEWPLILVNQYRRGKGDTFLKFYRVLP